MENDDKSTLIDLINLCEDAREFYASASEQTKDMGLRETFRKMASIREGIVINLKSQLIPQFGESLENGTVTGQAATVYKLLKARLGDTDSTLSKELEQAESKSRADFKAALSKNLSTPTRDVIERQLRQLIEAHDYIKRVNRQTSNHIEG